MATRKIAKNRREIVHVTPTTYKGHELVDIRIYAPVPGSDSVPTQKGVPVPLDRVPDLIAALEWALMQPCDPDAPERALSESRTTELANSAWEAMSRHGSAVHWDTIERMVLSDSTREHRWDLHFVLATRKDLFSSQGQGVFLAKKRPPR